MADRKLRDTGVLQGNLQLRPIGNPRDPFVAPPKGTFRSPVLDIANSLREISPDVNRYFLRKQDQDNEDNLRLGREFAESGKDYADLVRKGELEANDNPWWQRGYQEQKGKLDAFTKTGPSIWQDYSNWEKRESATPEEVVGFLQERRTAATEGQTDRFYLAGFNRQYNAFVQQITEHHTKNVREAQQGEAEMNSVREIVMDAGKVLREAKSVDEALDGVSGVFNNVGRRMHAVGDSKKVNDVQMTALVQLAKAMPNETDGLALLKVALRDRPDAKDNTKTIPGFGLSAKGLEQVKSAEDYLLARIDKREAEARRERQEAKADERHADVLRRQAITDARIARNEERQAGRDAEHDEDRKKALTERATREAVDGRIWLGGQFSEKEIGEMEGSMKNVRAHIAQQQAAYPRSKQQAALDPDVYIKVREGISLGRFKDVTDITAAVLGPNGENRVSEDQYGRLLDDHDRWKNGERFLTAANLSTITKTFESRLDPMGLKNLDPKVGASIIEANKEFTKRWLELRDSDQWRGKPSNEVYDAASKIADEISARYEKTLNLKPEGQSAEGKSKWEAEVANSKKPMFRDSLDMATDLAKFKAGQDSRVGALMQKHGIDMTTPEGKVEFLKILQKLKETYNK